MVEKGPFKELKKVLDFIYKRGTSNSHNISNQSKEKYIEKIKKIKENTMTEADEKIKLDLIERNIDLNDQKVEEFDFLDCFADDMDNHKFTFTGDNMSEIGGDSEDAGTGNDEVKKNVFEEGKKKGKLRTILCSATIEAFAFKKKAKKRKEGF